MRSALQLMTPKSPMHAQTIRNKAKAIILFSSFLSLFCDYSITQVFNFVNTFFSKNQFSGQVKLHKIGISFLCNFVRNFFLTFLVACGIIFRVVIGDYHFSRLKKARLWFWNQSLWKEKGKRRKERKVVIIFKISKFFQRGVEPLLRLIQLPTEVWNERGELSWTVF